MFFLGRPKRRFSHFRSWCTFTNLNELLIWIYIKRQITCVCIYKFLYIWDICILTTFFIYEIYVFQQVPSSIFILSLRSEFRFIWKESYEARANCEVPHIKLREILRQASFHECLEPKQTKIPEVPCVSSSWNLTRHGNLHVL